MMTTPSSYTLADIRRDDTKHLLRELAPLQAYGERTAGGWYLRWTQASGRVRLRCTASHSLLRARSISRCPPCALPIVASCRASALRAARRIGAYVWISIFVFKPLIVLTMVVEYLLNRARDDGESYAEQEDGDDENLAA
jgi:streptomycin 6-kinase